MLRWLATRRPVLLVRGLVARRDAPRLDRLAAEHDPERFMWAVLPHAARSFAASIVALPRSKARAAAVAYLYCRMLDTYEDLYPERDGRAERLRRFGARLRLRPRPTPDPIPHTLAADERDRLHLLLVDRCDLVDAVFDTLPAAQQDAITRLVADMADGMVWSTETLAAQHGVLDGSGQVLEYCRSVIGHTAVFAIGLLWERDPDPSEVEEAMRVGEMVQLANITRDIEKDLLRGVAYHPALEPFLASGVATAAGRAAVRAVRAGFLETALVRVPSYLRLFEEPGFRRSPAARAAAVMMLSFTDLHYRGSARRAGLEPWRGPRSALTTVLAAVPALVSTTGARRSLRRIERNFLAAAERLRSGDGDPSG
jgi:phytoene/squalene synthetase